MQEVGCEEDVLLVLNKLVWILNPVTLVFQGLNDVRILVLVTVYLDADRI